MKKIYRSALYVILWGSTWLTASSFNYKLGKDFVAYTPSAQPAKAAAVTNAVFNTVFRRVSDVAADGVNSDMASVVYSRWTPLSSTKKYLYLQRPAGWEDALIYSASDYSLIKILPHTTTIDGVPGQNFITMESAEIRWDYTGNHPERFYYVAGMKFLYYDVNLNEAHVIHDFAGEFPGGHHIMNDVEGDSSTNSRYWAWMVKGPYNGSYYPTWAIITYDKDTDTILGRFTVTNYQAYGGYYASMPTPNMVDISPSGKKVVCLVSRCWGTEAYGNRPEDIGSVFDGPHAWDLDFTDPVKVAIDETHSGWAWDYDGSELFVAQNNRNDWIEARNIQTGEIKQILYHGDLGWNNGFHFARMPKSARGWVLMSTYCSSPNSSWGDNQLIMLEVKDQSQNPRVWRLGHMHNNYDEYYAEGFAAMSQFGDKLWWGAKWTGQGNIEAYEMDLPATWWDDLSGGVVKPATHYPVSVVVSTNKPRFLWSNEAPKGALKYWLEVSDTGAFASLMINVSNLTVTNYAAAAALPDGAYYWRVQAQTTQGWQGWSSTAQFEINTAPLLPPSRPEIIRISAVSPDRIDLTWRDLSNETSYTLFRNIVNNSNTSARRAGFSANNTNYSDTGLAADTVYYYWVKAYNMPGSSGFSAGASARTLPVTVVTQGSCVAHWKFDEGTGATAYDAVGNNDGTVYSASWTIGRQNGALSFDGVNDYVDCGNAIRITNAVSISAWIRIPAGNPDYARVIQRANGDGNGFSIRIINNRAAFQVKKYSNFNAQFHQDLSTNAWHHIAGVYDGVHAPKIFVNGVEGTSSYNDEAQDGGGTVLTLGRRANLDSSYFNGVIDDVRLYDYALSQTAVSDIMNPPATNQPSAPARPDRVRLNAVSSDRIDIAWDDLSNESSYTLFRNTAEDQTTAKKVAGLKADAVSFSDTGLAGDTVYYYWIRAYNEYGASDYSPAASVRTLKETALTLEHLIIGPNPYKPNDGKNETGSSSDGITFARLTEDARIEIYTIKGQLVALLTAVPGDGKCVWQVPDRTASGVYICRVTNKKGESKTRKIVIIK